MPKKILLKSEQEKLKHKRFLDFCEIVASQSQCLSRHVGACLVKNNLVISSGYNKTPDNTSSCIECRRHRKHSGEALDICKAIHAEEMCLLNFLKTHNLSELEGATLYVSVTPCYHCAKLIIQCGIKDVYVYDDYNSSYTNAIFDEAGVKLDIYNKERYTNI